MTLEELNRRYPFDPRAKAEDLRGLDKLRAVPERGWALALYELYRANEKRWAVDEAKRRGVDFKQRQAGDRT